MERVFCQSCGMPLDSAEHLGTNKDGSANQEYCIYCYKDGAFAHDCTMDEMINHCVEYLDEFNKDAETQMTREEAIAGMKEYFPNLKRWKSSEN